MSRDARLGIVILAVADLPVVTAFYRSAFGWPIEVDTPTYVEFRLPAAMRLGIYAREAFGTTVGEMPPAAHAGTVGTTELYVYPDDLGAAITRVASAGGRQLRALARRDWGDEVAYFTDPAGNVIALARPARD